MPRLAFALLVIVSSAFALAAAEAPPIITDVECQPLAANAARIVRAVAFLESHGFAVAFHRTATARTIGSHMRFRKADKVTDS